MKTISGLLAFLLLCGFAIADDETPGPKAVAQAFYNGYMKIIAANGNRHDYVLHSPSVTAGFKKAYAELVDMGMQSDPIICGQDYPDAGFVAADTDLEDGKARVTMKSRGDMLQHSFVVTLKTVEGKWLISDTNDLKADAED